MLRALCGRTHEVLTGVCILHAGSNETIEFVEATRVTFHPETEVNIESYLARVHPLDKAGAYAAQEDFGALIKSIEGSFSNVVGLPVERVTEALAALGIRPR
jgi:septum formation protein